MASINVSSRWATNLYEPWEFATFTAQDIRDRIYGSKIVILLEQSMLICTWTTKCCMLLMYNRLAARLWHEQAIRVISVYVVLGFFACELAWFLSCRLFWGYWALPVPDPQCATYQHYSITQATFNISSDILMLCVGLMLVSKARLPPAKKVLLVAVFSCGLFVVLAGTCVYTRAGVCRSGSGISSHPIATVAYLWTFCITARSKYPGCEHSSPVRLYKPTCYYSAYSKLAVYSTRIYIFPGPHKIILT